MNRRRWIKASLLIFLTSASGCLRKTMTDVKMELRLAPSHTVSYGRINSIRLLAKGGTGLLAMLVDAADGAPAVHFAALDSAARDPSAPPLQLESPFGTPSWDVLAAEGGFAAVWTRPGSAISPLGYRSPAGAQGVLTGRYPSDVFQSPRFVRGAPRAGVAVTAVASGDRGGSVLVLFAESLESGVAPYVALPSAGAGLLADGLLLRDGPGYLLLVKLVPLGPRGAERRDGRGESLIPGVLHALRLDGKLAPTGPTLRPLGETATFEFDAELSGGQLLLLATTAEGYTVVTASATEGPLRWTTLSYQTGALVAPSVLATTPPFAATIESATTPHPRVMCGRLVVKAPPETGQR